MKTYLLLHGQSVVHLARVTGGLRTSCGRVLHPNTLPLINRSGGDTRDVNCERCMKTNDYIRARIEEEQGE